MKDLKNHGQGLNASPQVTIDQKRHKTIGVAVSCLGSLIGALCVVYITILLFSTTGA